MKKILLYALSISAFLLASCEKMVDNYGCPVVFSSRTGSQDTKTSYGKYDASISHQDINWHVGDELRVFSPQALTPGSLPYADYQITGEGSSSSIEPVTEEVDLRWGNPDEDGKYHFYSVYPVPSESGPAVTRSMTSRFVSGVILDDQTPAASLVTKEKSGNYEVGTDLPKYMMMVANKTVSSNSSSVNLDFRPLTTAIQFNLQNGTGADLPIYAIMLRSKSTDMPLSGPFNLEIDKMDTDGYEICRYADSSVDTENCRVYMKLDGVTLAQDKMISFTFFLHPSASVSDLTLGLYLDEDLTWCRYTTIQHPDGTGVTFNKHKKTIVNGLCIPQGIQWTMMLDGQLRSWTTNTSELLDFEDLATE